MRTFLKAFGVVALVLAFGAVVLAQTPTITNPGIVCVQLQDGSFVFVDLAAWGQSLVSQAASLIPVAIKGDPGPAGPVGPAGPKGDPGVAGLPAVPPFTSKGETATVQNQQAPFTVSLAAPQVADEWLEFAGTTVSGGGVSLTAKMVYGTGTNCSANTHEILTVNVSPFGSFIPPRADSHYPNVPLCLVVSGTGSVSYQANWIRHTPTAATPGGLTAPVQGSVMPSTGKF